MLVMCSTKALGSSGFEQARTIEIGAHHAGDIGARLRPGTDRPTKSGMAMGSGWALPCVDIHRQRGHGRQRREGGQNRAQISRNFFMPFSKDIRPAWFPKRAFLRRH